MQMPLEGKYLTSILLILTFKNDVHSGETNVGHLISSVFIFLIKCRIEFVQNGGVLIKSS